MPDTIDVTMPDGTVVQGVPSDVTKAQLAQKYAAHLQQQGAQPPGFLKRYAEGLGIPTNTAELGQAAKQTAQTVLTGGILQPEQFANYAIGAYRGAKQGFQDITDAFRNVEQGGPVGANLGKAGAGLVHAGLQATPIVGPRIESLGQDVAAKNYLGALGTGAAILTQAALAKGAEASEPTAEGVTEAPPSKLSLGPSAKTLDKSPISGAFHPALDNTPREVLQYAASKGIKLTPAEAAPKAPIPATVQAVGERSILGGGQLAEAREAERYSLANNVKNFADQQDPHMMGTSDAEAGDHIQRDAQVAMQAAKENAEQAYDEAGIQQANLAGNISSLSKFVNDIKNVRQPGAAVARPVYQSPAVQAALDDIASKPEALGPNPSIQSMRNLRSELWEKGNDYSGNIPDSARAIYKQAAGKVDDAIMDAAKGTSFEPAFRDANAQWKALQQKYNTAGAPLTRILQQSDPTRITNDLLNRASPQDIMTMKAEGMDGALQALRRRVIVDVANKGFRVNGDGLAGYSDGFLNQLFGAAAKKELYLNAEIARRMGLQQNPSGTSNTMLGFEQLTSKSPSKWMIPLGAANKSMPRPASSYLTGPGPSLPLGWTRGAGGRVIRVAPLATQQQPGGQQ